MREIGVAKTLFPAMRSDVKRGNTPAPVLSVLAARLEDHGLLLRGAFHPEPADGLAANVRTVALVGNAGRGDVGTVRRRT